MKIIIIPLLLASMLSAQTAPTAQRLFSGQTTATTVSVTNRGQVAHSLTVLANSAISLTDFDIRLEGSFDGSSWVSISADLTSAATNGTIAAATIRANGAYPRVRVNLVTASATPLSAYYVGTAVPTIEGFVFGGGTGSAPTVSIASVPGLQSALDAKAGANQVVPIPTGVGLLAVNTPNGNPQTASASVVTSALCGLTYFGPSTLCGGTAASLTSAIAPSGRNTLQGGVPTYTVTYTATGLSSAITPTVTGLPSGVTATFSPATVAATGGATTAAITVANNATLGTALLSFGGTSGAAAAPAVPASLVVSVPTGTLTSTGALDVTYPVTMPASTASRDWRTYGDAVEHKATGGNAISLPNCNGVGYYATDANFGSTVASWTDGTTVTSGSSSKFAYFPNGCNPVISVAIPDALTHHVTVYLSAANGNGIHNPGVTAHLSDNSALDATVQKPLTSQSQVANFSATFTVKMSAAGTLSLTALPDQVNFALIAIVWTD